MSADMSAEEKLKSVPFERPQEAERLPEVAKEVPAIAPPERPAAVSGSVEKPLPKAVVAVPVPLLASKDPLLADVESILEEDLATVYAALPPEVRPAFKAKGEETARTIREMIAQAKVKARRVLKLLVNWLKMIPGVNKFFLEQEAAIKTQKILHLADEIKKKK